MVALLGILGVLLAGFGWSTPGGAPSSQPVDRRSAAAAHHDRSRSRRDRPGRARLRGAARAPVRRPGGPGTDHPPPAHRTTDLLRLQALLRSQIDTVQQAAAVAGRLVDTRARLAELGSALDPTPDRVSTDPDRAGARAALLEQRGCSAIAATRSATISTSSSAGPARPGTPRCRRSTGPPNSWSPRSTTSSPRRPATVTRRDGDPPTDGPARCSPRRGAGGRPGGGGRRSGDRRAGRRR